MNKKNYIQDIRKKVGNEMIFLNFSCACIVNDKDEILLQKRSKDGNVWGFPGGAMELNESAKDTVIREVKEETGFDVKVDQFIGVYTLYFDKYLNGDKSQNIVTFFKCSIVGGNFQIDNKETFDLKFFNLNNIPRLFNKQHRDMLKDYLANKQGVCK